MNYRPKVNCRIKIWAGTANSCQTSQNFYLKIQLSAAINLYMIFSLVESVDKDELDIMMRNVDYLLVLYHDRKKRSQKALSALENIDDDCDEVGIRYVLPNMKFKKIS